MSACNQQYERDNCVKGFSKFEISHSKDFTNTQTPPTRKLFLWEKCNDCIENKPLREILGCNFYLMKLFLHSVTLKLLI